MELVQSMAPSPFWTLSGQIKMLLLPFFDDPSADIKEFHCLSQAYGLTLSDLSVIHTSPLLLRSKVKFRQQRDSMQTKPT